MAFVIKIILLAGAPFAWASQGSRLDTLLVEHMAEGSVLFRAVAGEDTRVLGGRKFSVTELRDFLNLGVGDQGDREDTLSLEAAKQYFWDVGPPLLAIMGFTGASIGWFVGDDGSSKYFAAVGFLALVQCARNLGAGSLNSKIEADQQIISRFVGSNARDGSRVAPKDILALEQALGRLAGGRYVSVMSREQDAHLLVVKSERTGD